MSEAEPLSQSSHRVALVVSANLPELGAQKWILHLPLGHRVQLVELALEE